MSSMTGIGDFWTGLLARLSDAPLADLSSDIKSNIETFNEIFQVFLILGTIVGIVVISYMLILAYKNRASRDYDEDKVAEGPELGELPGKSQGGKKLFLSFGISAIIVISLIAWSFPSLLHLNNTPDVPEEDKMEVEVIGYQWGWKFKYPNGKVVDGTLRLPEGKMVELSITSEDVFHNFGIPALKVKKDAIPGQHTQRWLSTENKTGEYKALCYELCGVLHSEMVADVKIMPEDEFNKWYQNMSSSGSQGRITTVGGGS